MAEIVIYPVPVIVDTAILILGCALEAVTLVTLVTNVNAIIEVIFFNLSFFQNFCGPFPLSLFSSYISFISKVTAVHYTASGIKCMS